MPSTDINGEPILILSMKEAEEIQAMMLTLITVNGPLYKHVADFLIEAREHVERNAGEQECTDLSP